MKMLSAPRVGRERGGGTVLRGGFMGSWEALEEMVSKADLTASGSGRAGALAVEMAMGLVLWVRCRWGGGGRLEGCCAYWRVCVRWWMGAGLETINRREALWRAEMLETAERQPEGHLAVIALGEGERESNYAGRSGRFQEKNPSIIVVSSTNRDCFTRLLRRTARGKASMAGHSCCRD